MIEKDITKRRAILRRWVNSPAGKEAMPILVDMFDTKLKHPDPLDTYFALGQREVVEMLRNLTDKEV